MFKHDESNLYSTRSITTKSATGGGIHLRSLTPGQHSPEQRRSGGDWRAVGDTVSDLTGQGIKPQTLRTYSDVLTNRANQTVQHCLVLIYKSN